MDQLTRTVKLQLAAFSVIAVVAMLMVGIGYMGLPKMLFGVGHYTVTMQLVDSGNLYPQSNVTYRGTTVGRVEIVDLTPTGVQATLSLQSNVPIPSDLKAEVHSQTAVGEQYVSLLPIDADSAPLRNGDVIPADRTSVPPNLNALLDATNAGLKAIPNDGVHTVIDEGYTALGGLGPEFSRFVLGSTRLAVDAKRDIGDITALINNAPPVLDTQADTADQIDAWSSHLASITSQLKDQDKALSGVLEKGAPAADQARQLIERINPTVPILLANLVSVGQVAVTYQPGLEQLLVLLPQGVAEIQGTMISNLNTKQAYKGFNLSFNLNLNLPPTCTTGFLPATERRSPTATDAPPRPAGDVYCRTPQDSTWNVRGARNAPCATKPGKRAPTAAMCESDEQYVPLNDGMNWKGDPNATLSGQDIPQLPPNSPPPPEVQPQSSSAPMIPALAAAEYNPATGTYIGPDGTVYTQTDLAKSAPKESTWQSMLVPPAGN
ncbi:MCE family protein [Mycolicibacterium fluoranthenivorans]|uniref:MCE family protein n=1 Tax=Mycolicibacterium fluoranthenivorans TaxID=258505 RepID=A0A7G8PGC8_9MYCO|nr:MlaD family protein [Mycolicibacterium fluoranthenivorans]QNJ93394.1 MCE family protein [Mycolicibacterium fluoranthenivorans]